MLFNVFKMMGNIITPKTPRPVQSLQDFFGAALIDPRGEFFKFRNSTAHVIMDAQVGYCGRYRTIPEYEHNPALEEADFMRDETAEYIGVITKHFRQCGLKTVIVTTDMKSKKGFEHLLRLNRVKKQDGDIEILKSGCDVLKRSNFEDRLHEEGIERYFLSGFHTEHCYTRAAVGGLERGFNVCALSDCTQPSSETVERLNRAREKALGRLAQEGVCVSKVPAVLKLWAEAFGTTTSSETQRRLGITQPEQAI